MKKRTESFILNEICTYLFSIKKYFGWRANNIPTFQKDRQCFRRMPKFARKGIADVLILHKGVFICLEVKSSSGRQSDDQKEFEIDVIANGGEYFIARSVEDVMEYGL